MIKRINVIKRIGLVLGLVLNIGAAMSQNYGNVWEFGDSAAIDFNSCNPIALTNGVNIGFEGCSSISDTSGQLLFYTNSDSVWNRLNQRMPNGDLIASFGTISQVIIFKKPLSNFLYYIITTKVQAQGNLSLQYHVVDMSLNGGLGDVISKNNVISSVNVTEQIAATMHSNGTDIWLMVHQYMTNHFLAFLVNSSGISLTPIISSVGPAHISCTSSINARGEIKFSPDGNKIAFNANGIGGNDATNLLTLFDFDNTTGIVSNPINLPFSRGDWGLSFSPDNSKLYGATWKAFNFTLNNYDYLYQFDLSSGIPATIINSKVLLDSLAVSNGYSYGDLKLGPNGKIYVAIYFSNYLGVINLPNVAGYSCNYVSNGIYLGGKICKFGLNNYIEYNNYCNPAGISEQSNPLNGISIFPNPATSTIQLTFNTKHNAPLICEIWNVMGEKVYEAPLPASPRRGEEGYATLDVSFLAKGMYVVRVGDGTAFENKKLVMQ